MSSHNKMKALDGTRSLGLDLIVCIIIVQNLVLEEAVKVDDAFQLVAAGSRVMPWARRVIAGMA